MGRPTKLTDELQEKICGYIADGNYPETAAQACGINPGSYYGWMKHGREFAADVPDDYEDGPANRYYEFFKAVKHAEALCETTALTELRKHWPEQWTAIATFLERRFPYRWGRKDRIEIDVRGEAERIARETGIDPDLIIAEAERYIAAARSG